MNAPGRQRTGALRTDAASRAPSRVAGEGVAIELDAAVLAIRASELSVAVFEDAGQPSLPHGPFLPGEHATLEDGLRAWVRAHLGIEACFLQQLCALSHRTGRAPAGPHVVSVGYIVLVGPEQAEDASRTDWRSLYEFLPWEDWRHGRPACLDAIAAQLATWAAKPAPPCAMTPVSDRQQRLRIAFGDTIAGWDVEKVLERYELLREARIVEHDDDAPPAALGSAWLSPGLVRAMRSVHMHVLARAIGELRRAVKWRPVVFALMQEQFTLFELQKAVEAILGPHLHKQNFRRLVENCGLVEPIGTFRQRTGGRPARLYRFRPHVVYERASPGVRLKPGRA
jgi:hypothetical protein